MEHGSTCTSRSRLLPPDVSSSPLAGAAVDEALVAAAAACKTAAAAPRHLTREARQVGRSRASQQLGRPEWRDPHRDNDCAAADRRRSALRDRQNGAAARLMSAALTPGATTAPSTRHAGVQFGHGAARSRGSSRSLQPSYEGTGPRVGSATSRRRARLGRTAASCSRHSRRCSAPARPTRSRRACARCAASCARPYSGLRLHRAVDALRRKYWTALAASFAAGSREGVRRAFRTCTRSVAERRGGWRRGGAIRSPAPCSRHLPRQTGSRTARRSHAARWRVSRRCACRTTTSSSRRRPRRWACSGTDGKRSPTTTATTRTARRRRQLPGPGLFTLAIL